MRWAVLAGLFAWTACLLLGVSEGRCQTSSRRAAASQTAAHSETSRRMPLLEIPLELAQLDLPPAPGRSQAEGLPEPYSSDLNFSTRLDANAAAQAATQWTPKPISQLTVNVGLPAGLLPRDHAAEREADQTVLTPAEFAARPWPVTPYHFAATAMKHQPLYFEEVNLERYGYSLCCTLQPTISAAHFFATVPALPYLMVANCPGECNYTLGHYRPGSCVPWRAHCCTRLDCCAGLAQSGLVYGLILLIP